MCPEKGKILICKIDALADPQPSSLTEGHLAAGASRIF